MMGPIRRVALAAGLLLVFQAGCKIPPWPDPTEGSVKVLRPLEAPIPWGKTCTIMVQGRPGLDDGLRSGLRRRLADDLALLRDAVTRELAIVGIFRKTLVKGESDYRLKIEVQESDKTSMVVTVVLQEARLEEPVAAYDVVGTASGTTPHATPQEATANVTAFFIALGLDQRRTKP